MGSGRVRAVVSVSVGSLMVMVLAVSPVGATEEPLPVEPDDLAGDAQNDGQPEEPTDAPELGDPAEMAAARAEAESSGERVEVISARDEWDTVYAEPSGEVTLETSIAAVRTRVGAPDGEWREIDTTLEKTADGVRPVAPALPMSFSAGGDEPLATIEWDGHELALSWPDELPEPVLEGDKARYVDVYPGVDLVMTVDPDGTGFSEVLVVESPAAAAKLPAELALQTEVSAGVELAEAAGGFAVTDRDGEVVFDAPQPVMWDSSGVTEADAYLQGELGLVGLDQVEAPDRLGVVPENAAAERLAQPVEGDEIADVATSVAANGRVGLVLDGDMLSDPETEWPVYIDPSTSGSRNAWTMIQSGAPNSTAGYKFSGDEGMGHCDVHVVSACNVDNTKRLIWEFDGIGSIYGADVSSATFRAYGAHSYSCADKTVRAYRVNNINSSSDWNNRSGWGSSRQVAYRTVSHKPACNDDRWIEFDVKEAAQWSANNSAQLRIGLRAKYENSMQDGWKRYRYDARLSITFNHEPNRPTNLDMSQAHCDTSSSGRPWISDNTPWFKAKITDPNSSNNVKAHFDLDRYGSSWYEIRDRHTGYGSHGTKTWQITDDLPDGRYRWRVRGHDKTTYGPFAPSSGYCYFQLDTVPPGAPSLSVDGPYELNTWVDASGRPQVTVTVDDNGDSSANKFRYGIGTSTPNSSWQSLSGGDGTFTFTPEFGVTTISARLRDKAQATDSY